MRLGNLFRRLARLEERRKAARRDAEPASEDGMSLSAPPDDAAELHAAVCAQLRAEGVKGDAVSMQRYRQALLASPEACEAAHVLCERQSGGMGQEKPQIGLKELPDSGQGK
jgi:hypothetical protein